MLSEMLGIQVPDDYLTDKPAHYTNVVNHVQEWNNAEEEKQKNIKLKKTQRRKKQEGMEVAPSVSAESESVATNIADS